jgi:hypothetical protein
MTIRSALHSPATRRMVSTTSPSRVTLRQLQPGCSSVLTAGISPGPPTWSRVKVTSGHWSDQVSRRAASSAGPGLGWATMGSSTLRSVGLPSAREMKPSQPYGRKSAAAAAACAMGCETEARVQRMCPRCGCAASTTRSVGFSARKRSATRTGSEPFITTFRAAIPMAPTARRGLSGGSTPQRSSVARTPGKSVHATFPPPRTWSRSSPAPATSAILSAW